MTGGYVVYKKVTRNILHARERERERERDLQEEVKGKEVTVFVLDEEVEDASFSKLMENQDSKQSSSKCKN